jgi:hypothetical protein
MYAYYRAVGEPDLGKRDIWILIGNLHLAAYEQHVAQTFVDLGLSVRPGKELRQLLSLDPPCGNRVMLVRVMRKAL